MAECQQKRVADPLLRRTDLMVKATWNEAVLAESDRTRVVEGNHYFPPDSINWEHFSESQHTTVCPWKGVASYYDIEVGGRLNRRAAWTYREPSGAAAKIKGYVAFWHGVEVVGDGNGRESGLLNQLRSMFG
jgi:uncharacterized protein (DUF427 family)